jgi:hypothetical protein
MKRQFADMLRDEGRFRVCNLAYYKNWENGLLGDVCEGDGLFHLDGNPMYLSHSNDVFIWCTALPTISVSRIREISLEGDYDCVVRINNFPRFIAMVRSVLMRSHSVFGVHCGVVQYNRGDNVTKAELNRQKFHANVFQKSSHFSRDCEYRICLVDYERMSTTKELEVAKHEDLCIGPLLGMCEICSVP